MIDALEAELSVNLEPFETVIPDSQVFIDYSSSPGLENAIRHAGDGAVIALNATARNSIIEVVVSDTGPGVAASSHPN